MRRCPMDEKRRRTLQSSARSCCANRTGYFNSPSLVLIASKLGRSLGVGVCSLYCTIPSLSMMKAARANDASAEAALPVEPGKGLISVTVSGQVILAP